MPLAILEQRLREFPEEYFDEINAFSICFHIKLLFWPKKKNKLSLLVLHRESGTIRRISTLLMMMSLKNLRRMYENIA